MLNRLYKFFVEVAANQEALNLARDQTKIAEEVYKAVAAKVEAGKVSQIQQNKAGIALAMAQINWEKAATDLAKSKFRLTTLWDESSSCFEKVDFPFYEIYPPSSIEECLTNLRENPELLRSHMEHLSANQNLNLEKASAIPDFTMTVGYKTLQETKEKGLIFGAAIPIPIYNRNQGNIQKARAEVQKSYDQYIALELALENKLSSAHKELFRSYNEAQRIESTVLKAAIESFELSKEGYMEGKFEYLEMLDAQKTLFEVREGHIKAILNYHRSLADIEYLTTQDNDL